MEGEGEAKTDVTPDIVAAAIDLAGVKTVMQIREEYATPHKALTDPTRYYDLSYYNEATGGGAATR